MASAVQVAVEKKQLVGLPLKRMEDPKFITGSGRYVDDIKFPNMLYAAFVRSPHANARINKVDVSRARAAPRVVGVLTARDLKGEVEDMPTVDDEGEKRSTKRLVLASERARYVGEAVAVVLAEDAYSAQDAAELVEVDYDPLDAVEDVEKAMKPSAPRVHDNVPNNVAHHLVHEVGDVERTFKEADEVISVSLVNQRVHPLPMEPRAVLANYDEGNDALTIWLSTQDPHGLRNGLADILKMHQSKVRLIAPDVGGGFGAKAAPYPEDVAVSYASKRFKRPVKWTEDRREGLLTTTHGRGQRQRAELAVRRDGKILGLRIRVVSDNGAYNTGGTAEIPELTYRMAPGVYDIGAYRAEIFCVLTNKVPQDAYRGAGRPEAAYLIERSVDIMARRLKLDPVGVRRLNYTAKEKFPFKTVGGYTYDSADYEANLSKALQVSNYDGLKREQREAREQGRLVGIGLVTWTEICGFSPDMPQTAAVTVTKSGDVIITAGGHPHGQGHATPFSQVVADELGIDIAKISFIHGDTNMLPYSTVTAGSRSAPLAASAALVSARKLKEKMGRIAAHALGSPEGSEMVFEDGKVYERGSPNKSLTFEKVASVAYSPQRIPAGMESTLFEYTAFAPPNFTFPFGTHVAMVEVDKETGFVTLLKYFAVDDCGKVLNPMMVEGQVHGGVVQGLGQAMVEEVVYDENGQLLTSTLADYCIPSAESVPQITWARTETATYANPLGAKGIGEAGTIASTPALLNAVEDALSPYGVVVDRMPVRPDYIKSLIK